MTEEEKFIYLRDVKGWRADEDGNVYGTNGSKIGRTLKSGYVRLSYYKDERTSAGNPKVKNVLAHRFIWWFFKNNLPKTLDHINQIKSDNRVSNLRSVTTQQNRFNTSYRGCTKTKYGWMVRIAVNYKSIYLGCFETEEEAHQVYLEAKKRYHII